MRVRHQHMRTEMKLFISSKKAMEDSGALPIEMDVTNMHMGDVVDIYPYEGKTCKHGTDEVITNFSLKTEVLLDEVQAGGTTTYYFYLYHLLLIS